MFIYGRHIYFAISRSRNGWTLLCYDGMVIKLMTNIKKKLTGCLYNTKVFFIRYVYVLGMSVYAMLLCCATAVNRQLFVTDCFEISKGCHQLPWDGAVQLRRSQFFYDLIRLRHATQSFIILLSSLTTSTTFTSQYTFILLTIYLTSKHLYS